MHKKLIVLVGLPRSGKSTYAKTQIHPKVNPDSIRLALHGEIFKPEDEPKVWEIAELMVKALFLAGNSTVILDATNVTKKRRRRWINENWKTVFYIFSQCAEVCIERAKADGRDDLIPVIERMAKSYEPVEEDESEEIYYV